MHLYRFHLLARARVAQRVALARWLRAVALHARRRRRRCWTAPLDEVFRRWKVVAVAREPLELRSVHHVVLALMPRAWELLAVMRSLPGVLVVDVVLAHSSSAHRA